MRSGWQVLISTSFGQMIAALLAPWMRYQVGLWTQSYSGIEFPEDYDQQVLAAVVICWGLFIGAVHMIVLWLSANAGDIWAVVTGGMRVSVRVPVPKVDPPGDTPAL